MIQYFKGSLFVSLLGAVAALGIGYFYGSTTQAALSALFITFVLSVLEVSLSFDNAVVNAAVLKKMTPKWQQRFLTWGIFIAVFVMRLVFPLLLVGVMANINPIQALVLAATKPDDYASLMLKAHVSIAAFGGAFLLMVFLKYFVDHEKDVHWIKSIEHPLSRIGRLEAAELAIAMTTLYLISTIQAEHERLTFLVAGMFGLVTYILVDGVSSLLNTSEDGAAVDINRASIGMFLYLEVLDSSFSFDGVVGAFAITNNLFIIMIGLGIGAMFVRSLTVMLVKKGTLEAYKYLEHGAFYAIGALAVIMFLGTVHHIPELISGFLGVLFIGLSVFASTREMKYK